MSLAPARFVDRRRVERRFSRVAASYAGADFLVREIDRRMLERLDYVRLTPGRILDVGCARGGSFSGLQQRYPQAQLSGIDISMPMLQQALPSPSGWRRWFGGGSRPTGVLGDAGNLPIRTRSTALLWSNMLLHWLDDPLRALAEAHRVLEVGGLLMFSTLGPDSLKELRLAFGDADVHTQRFADMHDLGDMLVECGFSDPVMDMEVLTLTYDDADTLFGELRAAGSVCAMQARRRGLLGRNRHAAILAAYEALRCDGRLPATFEVIYGHAWRPEATKHADGRAVIQLDQLRRQR